jgi:tetratricopeptide (TPR) repeat protein
MIARDEEQMLAGCLASVRGVVDEIVVVDTGSTDGTLEVARKAGAKTASIPWEDDFAKARNAALELATGDWILQLDADERLVRKGEKALRKALTLTDFDCGLLRLHNAARLGVPEARVLSGEARLGGDIRLPRLFRRDGSLRYQGAIHESVDDWLAARGMRVRFLEVDVVHLGRAEEVVAAKGKSERNLRILRARCAEEQEDFTLHGYLAHELLGIGLAAEAAEVVEAGYRIVLAGTAPRHRSVLRLALAKAMVHLAAKEPARVLETIDIAERIDGPHPDFEHVRGIAHELLALERSGAERVASAERAIAAHVRARGFARATFVLRFMQDASGHEAHLHEGVAHLLCARPDAALRSFDQALALRPNLREAELGRLEAMIDAGRWAEALRSLPPLLDHRPDAWLLAAACAEASCAPADAVLFTRNAQQRLAAGLWSPHLRERFTQALCAASAYEGAPQPGPGLVGALTAVMAGAPSADAPPVHEATVHRFVANVVRAQHTEQLVPLLLPEAERAMPGINALVRAALAALGMHVVSDEPTG